VHDRTALLDTVLLSFRCKRLGQNGPFEGTEQGHSGVHRQIEHSLSHQVILL
jgi:hypothetical protein